MGAGAMTALGTKMAIGGTLMSMRAQNQDRVTQNAVAKHNRDLAYRKAESVRAAAMEEQLQARKQAKRTTAENIAAVGASGVQFMGSPLLATLQTAQDMATNVAMIGFNAEQQARDLETSGEMGVFEANQANKAAKLAMAGTLIGGISDVIAMNRPKSKGYVSKETKALPTNRKLRFGNRRP